MDGLRSRVNHSRQDIQSTLRLAAGVLNQGDANQAQRLLEEAYAEVPDASAYVAALGAVAEQQGDYVTARSRYLEFVARAGGTPLTTSLATRLVFLRGKTAQPLAEYLVGGGHELQHMTTRPVVALPRITSPPGDPRLERLAIVVTELLVRDLRARSWIVIDWELSDAVQDEVASSPQGPPVASTVAERLGADFVVTGSIAALSEGFVRVDLPVHVTREGAPETVDISLSIAADSYGPERSRVANLLVESIIAVEGGVHPPEPSPDALFESPGVVDRFADGLLAAAGGDDAAALRAFQGALQLEPGARPIRDRVDQFTALAEFDDSASMPLFDEVLSFSRSVGRARASLRAVAPSWDAPDALRRSGALDAFGLDRLGAQTFIDILVTLGGSS